MKLLTIISHPYTLLTSFFFIIVGGQQIDTFYLLYLVTGLPNGSWYSIAGLLGIGVILYSHIRYREHDTSMDEHFTNLIGVIMLVLSLFLFFYSNSGAFDYGAFNQWVLLTSIMIFCIFVTCFIVIL